MDQDLRDKEKTGHTNWWETIGRGEEEAEQQRLAEEIASAPYVNTTGQQYSASDIAELMLKWITERGNSRDESSRITFTTISAINASMRIGTVTSSSTETSSVVLVH